MTLSWKLLGVDDHVDNGFVTSFVLPPLWVALCRIVLAIVTAIGLILGLIWTKDPGSTFSYFTWLSYWGLFCYFTVASVHSIYFVASHQQRQLLPKLPRFLQFLHVLLYNTITVYPYLVTIVFWSVLASGSNPLSTAHLRFENIMHHALNSVWSFTELIFLSRIHDSSMPYLNLLFLIVLLALYLGLAYLTYSTQGFYVYSFLNPKKHGSGVVAGYVFGILAATIVIYLIVKLVLYLKNRVGYKYRGPNGYKGMTRAVVEKEVATV